MPVQDCHLPEPILTDMPTTALIRIASYLHLSDMDRLQKVMPRVSLPLQSTSLWKHLVLTDDAEFTDKGMVFALEHAKKVKSVYINGGGPFLEMFLVQVTQVETIFVKRSLNIAKFIFMPSLKHTLRSLILWDCPNASQVKLIYYFRRAAPLPVLHTLSLRGVRALTNGGAIQITRYCPNLENLDLASTADMCHNCAEIIIKQLPKLCWMDATPNMWFVNEWSTLMARYSVIPEEPVPVREIHFGPYIRTWIPF